MIASPRLVAFVHPSIIAYSLFIRPPRSWQFAIFRQVILCSRLRVGCVPVVVISGKPDRVGLISFGLSQDESMD
jgi:hypothetical protein